MKLLVVVTLVAAASAFVERPEWEDYKAKHGKSYANPIEEFYRMKVYADNKAFVQKHMQEYAEGKHTFTVALNKFADLTNDEFNTLYNGHVGTSSRLHKTHKLTGKALPDEVDWRDQGVVTEVKSQRQCGSCWAFSAIGSLEAAWKMAGNELTSLSEQQLVDCSGDQGNHGCHGGSMWYSFDYIKEVGGIQSEADYPYIADDGSCKADKSKFVATVSGFSVVEPKTESALQDAVASAGPISVLIDANHKSFQLYDGGVYDEKNCTTTYLNHGVLVVGYGASGSQDYWLVKNSFDTDWGEDGYIRMIRNQDNQCGIAISASYPSV